MLDNQRGTSSSNQINDGIVRVKFFDAYADETCERNGQCSSNDERTFQIPNQCSLN